MTAFLSTATDIVTTGISAHMMVDYVSDTDTKMKGSLLKG
jgi:hypothetical protein